MVSIGLALETLKVRCMQSHFTAGSMTSYFLTSQDSDDSKLGAYPCHGKPEEGSSQIFVLTKQEEIRLGAGSYKACLDRANKADGVYIWGCHLGHGNQEWKYDSASGHVYDPDTKRCIHLETKGSGKYALTTKPCEDGVVEQEWRVDTIAGDSSFVH